MGDFSQIDAYQILELSQSATAQEIRDAYHRKMREGKEEDLVREAYSLIRDAKGQEFYLWNSVHSYFLPPPEAKIEINIEALIREIAFLSDWELGMPYGG